MTSQDNDKELIQHLCGLSGLQYEDARRLLEEVLAYFSESPEQYITTRHLELQSLGYVNKKIYRIIADELQQRRFPGPELSERQIRRMIYG